MDRKTRIKIEDHFDKVGGLFVPTEYGNIFIPKKARILKGGGPRVRENWGEDVKLEAGICVLTKDGEMKEDREWESKSFTRWFSRVMQALLDNVNPTLTDFQGSPCTPNFSSGGSDNPMFLPAANTSPAFGLNGGTGNTGAMLAIGNGPLTGAQSGFFTLKSLLFIQDARVDGITTQDDGVASAYFFTTGITLATIGGTTIQEVGLFSRIKQQFQPGPQAIQMAYDEVNPGVVAAYGDVIAPKYSTTFAA